jgi:renalase
MAPTVVVGAGLAGLLCAATLSSAGREVIVLDKGRSPGGRLATRRIEGATLDHGAQFFTVRTTIFQGLVDRWLAQGLVHEWCRGFGGQPDGHPRYRVARGMNALAKHLAAPLDVRCNTLAFAVRPHGSRWDVVVDDGTVVPAAAVVVTTPVPQALSLLIDATELPAELRGLEYDRTLTLLAVLDRPPDVPSPGGVQEPDGTFAFVADNQAKGLSARPALTLHVRPELSDAWWDADRDEMHERVLAAARPWFGDAQVVTSQVKRWRFATPRTTWPEPCWRAGGGAAPLVLAGDAYGGPRVEGAALSGIHAAAGLLR